MKIYSFENRKGFGVFGESNQWRMAFHVYEESVNGINALNTWGIHIDSDEAFVLLNGSAVLVMKNELKKGKVIMKNLQKEKVYLVEKGQPHILILNKDGKVLIVENRNMDNSVQRVMLSEEKEQICNFLKGVFVE